MARRKGRGVGDVARYTGTSSRPPSFRDEPEDDTITSATSFFLISLTLFIAISFAAVYFGTRNIEQNLTTRSQETLDLAGFHDVDVEASGATVILSGSITTEQSEDEAFSAVAALAGVRSVEGKLWPVFSGELEEIVITGDALEINWDGDSAIVEGNVASQDRRTLVYETLVGTFPSLDIENLTVLEGLSEESGWLGSTLGLLKSISPSLVAGRLIVDPNGKLLVVAGEVEDKELRNELNAKVTATADELGFKANPAIRLLETGPSQEEIEELQVNLDELIEGKVVEFGSKSYQLTDKGKELLDEILDALSQAPEVRVGIAGHTDDRGSEDDNQQLSEDRAKAVLEYLIAGGESRERFDVIGYGESDPKESNSTKAGRARNRRIEFIAVKGTS
jgi:outer membrane protein OmpA-like peptidoglycan-associated protein